MANKKLWKSFNFKIILSSEIQSLWEKNLIQARLEKKHCTDFVKDKIKNFNKFF